MTAKQTSDQKLKSFHGGFDILDALPDARQVKGKSRDTKKEQAIRETKHKEALDISARERKRRDYLTIDNERIWTVIR